MSFNITWRELCKINILHGFYLHPEELAGNSLSASEQNTIASNLHALDSYNIAKDVGITPNRLTQQLMAGFKLKFRATNSGMALWCQVEDSASARLASFIPVYDNLKLSFFLKLENPAFLNFTNFSLSGFRDHIYYFSNQAGNMAGTTRYLNSAGTYASDSDRLKLRPQFFSIDVSGLGLNEILFTLTNQFNSAEIICSNVSTLESCELNWRGLPAGRYTLRAFDSAGNELSSLAEDFYLDDGDIPNKSFAVIELFHLPSIDLSDYALLDITDNRSLLQPEFTLWWQNRMTRWRYIFNQSQSVSPDPLADVSFSDSEQRQLWTRELQPLVSGFRPIRFQHDTDVSEEILLPNPGVETLYPEGGAYFSDVYLGNFDLSRM